MGRLGNGKAREENPVKRMAKETESYGKLLEERYGTLGTCREEKATEGWGRKC